MNNTMHGAVDDALTRLSNGLTRWVLGLGLLSLHATIFAVAMVGMVLWNIYDSPGNLWVDEVFYRWTAVLAFHAVALGCGWAAWRLMRSEQEAMREAQRNWTPVPSQMLERPALEARVEPKLLVSGSPGSGGAIQRYAESAHRAEDVAKRALTTSAAFGSAFMRRTAVVVASTANRLSHRGEDQGTAPAVVDPMQTWPENPIRHRPEDQEFISRFAGRADPAPDAEANQAQDAKAGTDVVLNVSSRPEPEPRPVPHVGKEPGQTWIEAATFVWHGPHAADDSPSGSRQNGHRQDPPASDQPPQ